MVARDGDGVGQVRSARLSTARSSIRHADVLVDVNINTIMVVMMVMVVVRVDNLVGESVDALAEGVVVA